MKTLVQLDKEIEALKIHLKQLQDVWWKIYQSDEKQHKAWDARLTKEEQKRLADSTD